MATEVRVPEVSENVSEGTVISVLIAEGDLIEMDQSLIELETDKAVVAIPSPLSGRVESVQVAEGDTLKIGDLILTVEPTGEALPSVTETAAGALAETDGAGVGAAEASASSETAPMPESRILEDSPEPPELPAAEPAPVASQIESAPRSTPADAGDGAVEEIIPAAPSVRRLARQLGVDLKLVRGSGPGARISQEDVQDHVKASLERGAVSVAQDAPRSLPDFTRWGEVRREALGRVREITAGAMSHAWRTIPQVTQYDRADISGVEEFRRGINERRRDGAPMSMTAVLLKVAAAALREFPRFGASLDEERRELIYKDYVHIGVAVDTPHGLLVPVIRDVDDKTLDRLNAELAELADRTRERRVNPAELEGGVFTISNLGGIGGTNFSPIVYAPQVAILGVARARTEPVWQEDRFVPRLILPLALSYDHRVIDGADAARFLAWMVQALEQPLMLMLK